MQTTLGFLYSVLPSSQLFWAKYEVIRKASISLFAVVFAPFGEYVQVRSLLLLIVATAVLHA